MSGWYCRVLGQPNLTRGEERVDLELKTAALLAYLACAGPTSRSRLAGPLGPGSSEATARDNLSQLLRRLRLAAGADLVEARDPLRLVSGLRVDVAAAGHGAGVRRAGEP